MPNVARRHHRRRRHHSPKCDRSTKTITQATMIHGAVVYAKVPAQHNRTPKWMKNAVTFLKGLWQVLLKG